METTIYSLFSVHRNIAKGILHIHEENLIHRDLAARNILACLLAFCVCVCVPMCMCQEEGEE